MKTVRNLRTSLRALLAHPLRTGLALSGVAIGIAAVIVTTAIGEGAEREVLARIQAMGTNLLVVRAGPVKKMVARRLQTSSVTTLTLEDHEALAETFPWIARSAPSQDRLLKVRYGDGAMTTTILGTTPEFVEVRNFALRQGRVFTEEENRAASRVAVLGARVSDTLFDGEDPISETIRLRGIPFEVIGVLEEKGVSADSDEDNQILIPLRTVLRRVFNCDHLNNVFISVRSPESMEQAETEIRQLLRERHRLDRRGRPDDFSIQNQVRVIETERETASSFGLLITGVAALSLLVGGTGILALMLLSVKERTAEIGLRLAVGARRRDVLVQFLAEALALAALGGVAGVALGALGSWGVRLATEWQTHVSLAAASAALAMAAGSGLAFGVYPARKASLLEPIEALSAE